MRIAVIQVAYGEGSEEPVERRAERVAALLRQHGAGHDLVVLPELWSAGGFAAREWEERSQSLSGIHASGTGTPGASGPGTPSVAGGEPTALPPALAPLAQVTREIGAVVHAGSVVERTDVPGPEGRDLWNTSVVLDPEGVPCATYRKVHRFGFGAGEPRLMEAGTDLVVTDLPAPADSLTAGLSTCYDLRFPELYRRQVDLGAEMLVVVAAWPAARVEAWRLLLRARAVENQCFVIGCNTAGTHAGQEMGGRSAVVDPWGTVLAEAGTGEEVLSAQIDPGRVRQARTEFPVLADRRL